MSLDPAIVLVGGALGCGGARSGAAVLRGRQPLGRGLFYPGIGAVELFSAFVMEVVQRITLADEFALLACAVKWPVHTAPSRVHAEPVSGEAQFVEVLHALLLTLAVEEELRIARDPLAFRPPAVQRLLPL